MRLITSADDKLYGLASAAGKLRWTAKLLPRLDEQRRAEPADAEAAYRYALALMAVLPSVGAEFAAQARLTATIGALGEVLALDPGNWLARYGRARLRMLFPSSYGMFAVQVPGELASAREDLELLLGLQAGQPFQPYFVSTHALAAVADALADKPAGAGRLSTADTLASCPRTAVRLPALGAILCEPLVTLHAGSAGRERHMIGELMSALYGDQAIVAAAMRRPARQPARW